jgi:hypothetical protein
MADLSALGGLQAVEPLDLANYVDAKESTFRLAPKGVYTLQAPPSFPTAAFSRTKSGNLSIQVDPTIAGPSNEGYTIRFVKISGKQFDRSGQKVSQIGDYLRACGYKGTLRNEQEQADAVESTANQVYQAKIDWRAFNKKTGFTVEGMERFPKREDGTYQSWIEDPTDKDENGKAVRVPARLYIPLNGFIPAL